MDNLEYGQYATYNGKRYMVKDWEPETTIVNLFSTRKVAYTTSSGEKHMIPMGTDTFAKFAELSQISDYRDPAK